MPDLPQAPPPRRRGALMIRSGLLPLAMGLACGTGTLEPGVPSASTSGSSGSGDTLPPLSTGEATTTGGDQESGALPPSDDPLLCAPGCELTLPVDWTYEGAVWPAPDRSEPPPPPRDPPVPTTGFDPRGHLVATMLHDPASDALVIGEQRDGIVVLHRLDRLGRPEWSVPLALPCDLCDLTHVARHPSGDLLLSATGLLLDRGLGLIAGRYDPVGHQLVWATTTPLFDQPGTTSYSGEIAALSSGISAQLYLERTIDFEAIQRTLFIIYGDDGAVLEGGFLTQDPDLITRYPLLARRTVDDELMVQSPFGNSSNVRGFVGPMAPPLWSAANLTVTTPVLDDLHPDARGHLIGLGHTHDGAALRAVLSDRVTDEDEPRWIATLAIDSTTDSRTSLAVGPQGEPYAAVRTTQALAPEAEPLVGLSLARWTTEGELRWHTTILQAIDDSHNPVELAVDADEGLVIAAVVDDQLRVERRTQHCECGGAP